MDSSQKRLCDAEVQCNLHSGRPRPIREIPYVQEQVLWVQRNVFHRGRFLSVREVGTQTDENDNQYHGITRTIPNHEEQCGTELTFDSVFGSMPAFKADNVPNTRSRSHPASFVSQTVSQETRQVSKRVPRRAPRSAPVINAADEDRQIEEIRYHMLNLTANAFNRARDLEEHVEDLNHQATAALISARQFQSHFNPNHAFECSSSLRRGTAGYSGDDTSRRTNGKNAAAAAPALPSVSRAGCKASTKMPWQELQATMSGCPNATLGCKVLLTGVEKWSPAVLSELPDMPRLRDRLAVSAGVYNAYGGSVSKPAPNRRNF